MDDGCHNHGNAAPGVKIIPGMAVEQNLNVVQRIAPTLEAASGQEEKVNSLKDGNECTAKKRRVNPPVLLSLFGHCLC